VIEKLSMCNHVKTRQDNDLSSFKKRKIDITQGGLGWEGRRGYPSVIDHKIHVKEGEFASNLGRF
jgi:hypothetical protein